MQARATESPVMFNKTSPGRTSTFDKAPACLPSMKARASFLKGDLDYANDVYDSVLNIDDKNFDALNGKALVYFDKKDYLEADKFFKKASIISPLSASSKTKWDFCLKKLKEE